MDRYDITIQMLGVEAPGPQYVWEKVPAEEGELVLYTDAQATIAALQARVKELEEWQQIVAGTQDRQDLIYQISSQLTQRTAELEAVNKHCEIIEERKAEAYKEVEIQLLAKANLQAELERVRADNKALDEWRADVTVSLQRPGGAFFVDVPQHIKDLVKERDDLRTLLLALPKVEGAVVVSNGYVKDSTRCHALFGADEDAALYAALLQHRQGMEG